MTGPDHPTDQPADRATVAEQGRYPRADAQRNLDRLVSAARIALDEVGVEVTAHEIARRAGVGIGTFYRRVGSREALLEAVLAEMINETVTQAGLALAVADPWQGFADFAMDLVQLHARSRGISAALGGQCGARLDQPLVALRDRIQQLVERAQQAGVLRSDVTWQDIPFLLTGAATIRKTLGIEAGPEQWRRNLRIVLDGLRITTQ